MKNRFTKSDIEFHGKHHGYNAVPSVNVKSRGPYLVPHVMEKFKCCEATAQKALEYVWSSAVENFWEDASEIAERDLGNAFRLGKNPKIYSSGRSGGWLYVDAIGNDVETWDAIKVSAWGRFVRSLESNVTWYSSKEYAFEMIEGNDWAPADSLLDEPEQEAKEAHEMACRDIPTI